MKGLTKIILGSVSVFCVLLMVVYTLFFSTAQIHVLVDHRISAAHAKEISAYVKECVHKKISKSQQDAEILAHVPYIKDIQRTKNASGVWEIRLVVHAPLFSANSGDVVLSNGSIVPHVLFAPSVVCALQHVDIKPEAVENAKVPEHFLAYMSRLSNACFKRFALTWVHKHRIWFQDKEHKKFFILSDDQTELTDDLLRHCMYVKKELQEQGLFERKKSKAWGADIRFKHQIVVFAVEGGEYERGTNC